MNALTAFASMCLGSIFLSLFIMVFTINLAYLARGWFYTIRDMLP